jgi:signal transduction histidine kinase
LVAGALLNLLSNAVKYSPRGGTVTLQALVIKDQVEFQVRNSGPVIPEEDLERIFEPYYRVPDQSGGKPGWGLGLAFVKRISEQHCGGVQVSSNAYAGTCFCLTLPLRANIAAEAVV